MSSFPLSHIIRDLPEVRILDLGAAPTESVPAYQPLVTQGLATVIAIDGRAPAAPQDQATRQLFLGDGELRTFYVTRQATASSLLRPNPDSFRVFDGYTEALEVIGTDLVQTARLDDIGVGDVDYIKSDLQGSDLMVLAAGRKVLSSATVVDLESEFIEQYSAQPRFGALDLFLQQTGFDFYGFYEYGSRPLRMAPDVYRTEPSGMRRWLWANGFWIRSIQSWETLATPKLLPMAAILHDVIGSFDHTAAVLQLIDRRTASSYVASYLRELHS